MYDSDNNHKELTPIAYSSAAIKVLHFKRPAHNSCFRFHWHDRIELIRVKKGDMCITHGTHTSMLHPGDLIFIPPRTPHRGFTSTNAVQYDVLMFDVRSFYNDSELCKTYLPAIFEGRAKFRNVINSPETIQCFDSICANWESASLTVTAKIYQLLALFIEHDLLEFQRDFATNDTVKEMIEYIETHYMQDISTASLCAHFGYTATHFGRKFKEGTGLTPMNYLRIYRMEHAYKLLKNSKKTISEIATLCGFSDPNYFTRCFKNHFGVAPSQLKDYE